MTQSLRKPNVREMDSALLVDLLESGFTLDEIKEMSEPGWVRTIAQFRLNPDEVAEFRRLYLLKCRGQLPHSVFYTLFSDCNGRGSTLSEYINLLQQQPGYTPSITFESKLKSYRRGRDAGISEVDMLELLSLRGFDLNVYLAAIADGLGDSNAKEYSTFMDEKTYEIFQSALKAGISQDEIVHVQKVDIPRIEAEVGDLHFPFSTYVTLRTEEPKLSHAEALETVQKVCTRYDGRRLYLAAHNTGRSHIESLAIAQYQVFDTFLASSVSAFIGNKGIQATELIEILKAPPEVLQVLSEIIAFYA